MPKRGKNYRAAAEKIDSSKQYTPDDGVKLLKETSFTKFDSSVELHIRTGLDPKHADQQVRGSAVLPAGTGRTQRVVAFAQGDKAREAEAAGADVVGAEELVIRIQGGWTDFDVAVATPDMMGMVGRLGRVLGPRGLMPNPRSGTVTPDIGRAIREIKGGRVEFRVDRTGVIHAPVGKVSFDEEKIVQNIGALVDAVVRAKPTGAKGTYLKTFNIASTMGPSIELDQAETLALASSEA
ncbi:MAG: 50S ribosomal protein L1 [Chloroflexi bacterium]|nr:50S ribosomal protein L1 [Chloroflexota bacterium]MBV9596524.1 50S ribosomal protein L1 [Chloroflexota bacterium]